MLVMDRAVNFFLLVVTCALPEVNAYLTSALAATCNLCQVGTSYSHAPAAQARSRQGTSMSMVVEPIVTLLLSADVGTSARCASQQGSMHIASCGTHDTSC